MALVRSICPEPVLFVSHQASRTGAPNVLLHLLRWASRHTDLSFHVLLLRPGPLENDFRAIGPVTVLTDLPLGQELTLVERELSKSRLKGASSGIRNLFRLRLRHLRGFRAVYLNSVCSVPSLRYLPTAPTTVITHAHELAMGIRSALSPSLLAPLAEPDRSSPLRSTDLFIAAADCVKTDLVAIGIEEHRVRRHYEFVDVERVLAASDLSASVRRDLGLGPSTQIVMGCGTIEWRKGPDLFVQLAHTFLRRSPDADVRFVWLGGDTRDNREAREWFLDHDVRKSGLGDRVLFVRSQPNPLDYFRLADIFVLTSREDPFPLVCLEASLLRKPIVSFDSGGMGEFLADGRGVLVRYLDVEAMATAVGALLEDPVRSHRFGVLAAERVRHHHDVSVVAPPLLQDVAEAIASARGRRHRPVPTADS